jgi:urease accessory protein
VNLERRRTALSGTSHHHHDDPHDHDHPDGRGHGHPDGRGHGHEHPLIGVHDEPLGSARGRTPGSALRVGIGGPVGTGKTELVACLCRALSDLSVVVVTNDVFTTEDASILERKAVLPTERIVGVQTGCCPHTAIRDDISENLDVVEDLEARFEPDVVLVESGGDNLTLTFSRALVDVQLFVIDVAGGDKVPRKGGPGITTSDLLVINKVDLAPMVGADLEVMRSDSRRMRGDRPFVMVSLRDEPGATEVASWIRAQLGALQVA